MDGALAYSQHDWDEAALEVLPPAIGTAERRLNVRAYEHWVGLLDGRAFPAIADLDLDAWPTLETRSVLLDYRAGPLDPRMVRIGRTLRDECGADDTIAAVSDVPRGSLLSRLTDHWLEVLGARAPIGFEAEFTNHRDLPTLYRGILMPFSSGDGTIDHVLGVINWKHNVPTALDLQLRAELGLSLLKSKPSRH